MSDDLEDRLRRTLAEDADRASVPPDLAGRARAEGDRRTHRRRGWLIGTAAALTAAGAIVIAVVSGGDPGGRRAVPATPSPAIPSPVVTLTPQPWGSPTPTAASPMPTASGSGPVASVTPSDSAVEHGSSGRTGPAASSTAGSGSTRTSSPSGVAATDRPVASPSTGSASTGSAVPVAMYGNPRFDVHCLVLSGPDTTSKDSDNGDGRKISRPDGANTSCSGRYVIFSDAEELASEQQPWTDDGWTITLRDATPTQITLSGTKGDQIFYAVARINPDRHVIGTMTWTYPASKASVYNLIVERAEDAFHV